LEVGILTGLIDAEHLFDEQLQLSFFAMKEPGFFGVMEPVFGRANGHPDGVKNAWF